MAGHLERQYRRLDDEAKANVSAQRHLVSSEQALQAARAGCDVRAERWTTNPGCEYGHAPLFDRPSHRMPRSTPRANAYSRRTLPVGPHPISDLSRTPPSRTPRRPVTSPAQVEPAPGPTHPKPALHLLQPRPFSTPPSLATGGAARLSSPAAAGSRPVHSRRFLSGRGTAAATGRAAARGN